MSLFSRAPVPPSYPSPWWRAAHWRGGGIEGERGRGGEADEEEGEWERTVQTHQPQRLLRAYSRVADAWARAILSNPAIVVNQIRGKKGGA